MASGIVKREANRYNAVYEKPYGGVASDADAADIAPNQFVQADGLVVKNGRLCVSFYDNIRSINFSNVAGQDYWNGADIQFVGILGPRDPNAGDTYHLVAIDAAGNAWVYNGSVFVIDQSLGSPISVSSWVVIAGVLYLFDFDLGQLLVYTPFVSFVLGNDYVAGKYSMVLQNYLITANSNQPTDVPPVKTNRYNWSGPFKFTTWDPAIDRTAGFNTLSSASDQITQLFAMGNVGYILRDQGLTQLTPTGVATAPFDPTSLWDSQFGIGCTYPDTFAQYGSLATWLNDNNLYAFYSGTMPQGITGSAKAAIYADINAHESDANFDVQVTGSLTNTSDNSILPELFYTLCIASIPTNAVGAGNLVIWIYNIADTCWTRVLVSLDAVLKIITGNPGFMMNAQVIKATAVSSIPVIDTNNISKLRRILNTIVVRGVVGITPYSFMLSLFINEPGSTLQDDPAAATLVYREEEFRLGTSPTVRGVIVKAFGQGTINCTVGGKTFTPIIIPPGSNTGVYKAFGEITQENPQLSMSISNFSGCIIKASMDVTFDEGDPL